MKRFKTVTIAVVLALTAVGVLGVGLVFAQSVTPWGQMGGGMMQGYGWQNGTPAPGMGSGMMGGGADTVQAMHAWMSQSGGMHTVVWEALAETLDLSPEALQAELADGQTLAEVAQAQGVDPAELAAVLEAAMQAGLEEAVAGGALTQAQADQMRTAMAGRYAWMIQLMASGQMGGMMGPGLDGGCHASNFS